MSPRSRPPMKAIRRWPRSRRCSTAIRVPRWLSTWTPGIRSRRVPCHMATTGIWRVTEVGEQAWLSPHVAEQDDAIALACLEDGGQLEGLGRPGMREAEHDVVAACPSRARDCLDGAREEGSVVSRTIAPRSIVGAPRSARANGFGRKSRSRAAARTRSRVSCAMGTVIGALFKIRETVLRETPVAMAMSFMVGGRPRLAGPSDTCPLRPGDDRSRGVAGTFVRSIGHSKRRWSKAWIETEMRMTAP